MGVDRRGHLAGRTPLYRSSGKGSLGAQRSLVYALLVRVVEGAAWPQSGGVNPTQAEPTIAELPDCCPGCAVPHRWCSAPRKNDME